MSLLVASTLLSGCGTTAAAPASPSPTLVASPGARQVMVNATVTTGSKVTVRVREQLAGFPAQSDAVLVSEKVTGQFSVRRDGTFSDGSRIVVSLDALRSDSTQRDRYIKDVTLDTKTHPSAELVPVRAVGLQLPIPASGQVSFRIEGNLTIRGTTKPVTFDATATRSGNELRVRAQNAPVWRFADFGLEIPSVFSVLSIVDEIRLEVELVARDS